MPRPSPTSVGATYLDRTARIEALRQAARRAAARLPPIRRMILFGSLAAGTPTPRSDADILVVVEASEHPQARDRVPELLGALAPRPCPIDLVILTSDEFERARREQVPLLREALGAGIELL